MNKAIGTSCIMLLTLSAASAGPFRWAPASALSATGGCQPYSFDWPGAIAVDQLDDIYIANGLDQSAVQILTPDGSLRTILNRYPDWTKRTPQLSLGYYGLNLAVDSAGHLYLAVKSRGTVEKLDANGTFTVVAGKPGDRRLVDGSASQARLDAPGALAVDNDGIIYVADTQVIREIRPDKSIITLAGNPRVPNPNPRVPYYADGRGMHVHFMSPNGMVSDGHGSVYVADGYDGGGDDPPSFIGLVRKITPGGTVETVAGSTDVPNGDFDGPEANGVLSDPLSIAIDPAGAIYMAEPLGGDNGDGAIRKIGTNGELSTVLQAADNYPNTEVHRPSSVAIDSKGVVFVVDDLGNLHESWLHRIIKGQVETLCENRSIK
ncbi:MAG TPA: hypothetical protein VFX20_19535 [Steroidobacteraceae bacterium]|nr:hypothetical protein [Steroidobacteraceae bacterium]